MTKLIDNICALRDVLQTKNIYELSKKLYYKRGLIQSIFNEVHRQLAKKSEEYDELKGTDYDLSFTSQDLRELAQDIRNVFKKWDTEMNPEKNIKALKKSVKDGVLNTKEFTETKTQIMKARRDHTQILTELLSLLEFHSVFLYYLEIASKDEFAIKYTERL